MIPYDTGIGDFRAHYAGFFDPGFGLGRGSYAVLEVKTNEVPFLLEDGQTIARIKYEKLNKNSNIVYGKDIKSNYQNQDSLDKIKSDCEKKAIEKKLEIIFFQSNNEGEIIDKIHEVNDKFDGLIINPAAFTHSSIAILDSLRAINKPKIEIHLSNIYAREEYRKKSITSEGVHGLICGFGGNSYLLGIEAICKLIYK